MKQPRWDLKIVKQVASQEDGLLLSKTRALAFFSGPDEAYTTALREIMALSIGSFVETTVQQFGEIFDAYGIVMDGKGWMLKFTVYETLPQVMVVSLHPLERSLKTNKGEVKP